MIQTHVVVQVMQCSLSSLHNTEETWHLPQAVCNLKLDMLQWATSNYFCCSIRAGGLVKKKKIKKSVLISLYEFSRSRPVVVIGIALATQTASRR